MRRRLVAVAIVVGTVWVTFAPSTGFALLNWDDNLVIVDNAALAQPGVARWAFTTFHMEHYQPVSWLAWGALRGSEAPSPAVYHTANLVLHAAAVAMAWAVAAALFAGGPWTRTPAPMVTAGVAALLWGLHPLRVEVVAWVSAMPYALATLFALASTWIWFRDATRTARVSWMSLAIFVLSLLSRPVALGLPVVFALLDGWGFHRGTRLAVRRALPFAAASLAAAGAEFVARTPAAAEVSWAYRLQSASTAPFVYLWRTVAPASLTPLDVLPLAPVTRPEIMGAALLALALVTAAAWRWRTAYPGVLVGWGAYLALLAPAGGLLPSGLQATADRYTYLPGLVLAMGLAAGVARWAGAPAWRGRLVLAAALVTISASAVASRAVLAHWSDSIALWTRVVALDAANDVGLYNLGVALSAAGDSEGAAERYRAVLAINPAHVEARQHLDRLDAARLEREANALASQGQLAAAAARYQEVLARDPRRPHAHAARGMALASLGRSAEAIPHLREALALGIDDVAIPNTLAGLLFETGATREARAVLEGALATHPNDVGLAHNLARVLVMVPGLPPPDRMRAYRLADAVVETTGGQDARALDTLAAALAGIDRLADARAVSARAVAVATAQGDRELAVQIAARGRAYR